jgi:hypothetical protein
MANLLSAIADGSLFSAREDEQAVEMAGERREKDGERREKGGERREREDGEGRKTGSQSERGHGNENVMVCLIYFSFGRFEFV